MLQDLKQALRMLAQTKGWTAVVLLSLALGIGANTALFTAVNGLMLRTVPVPQPENLVRIRWSGQNEMRRSTSSYGYSGKNAAGEDIRESMSYPMYQTLLASNQTLSDIAASVPSGRVNVIVDGKAELASALLVTGNFFPLLKVPAWIGRTITPEDDTPSAPVVAVISYGYWQKRFGGSTSVLGKVVSMNNASVTIVGVTPPEYTGIENLDDSGRDIALPLSLDGQLNPVQNNQSPRMKDATYWFLQIVGRLKPGITAQQVRGNLDGTFQAFAQEGWKSYIASLTPEQRSLSRNQNHTKVPHLEVDSASGGIYATRPNTVRSAWILSVVVGLILVIVCANVANLLLSRASSRQKEIAVRLSMGATRFRLVRQLLTESVLLASIGGILGNLLGYWSRQLLPFGQTAPIDWRVIAFSALLCLATGIAFGTAPALRATRVDLSGAMKENSRSVSGSRSLLSKALLGIQVAISLVVLIGAGLFLRTMQNLRNVDVGFNTQNLVVFNVTPRLNGYDAARSVILYDALQQNLKAIPGVRGVARSSDMLLSGNSSSTSMFIQGKPESAGPSGKGQELWVLSVSPDFFDTLQIPVLRGRNFDPHDMDPKGPKLAILNETAARKYFPNEDPLGKRFGQSLEQAGDVEIVGIVRDTKYDSLRNEAPPTWFQPFSGQNFGASFEVRFVGPLAPMVQAIRDVVQKTDPNLPLVNISTQNELVAGRFEQERFFAMAYSLFGGLGLLLASIGLFGLMSYSVARRTNEIGIRMALGAERRDVVRMVLGESLLIVVIGVIVGVGITLAAGRLVRTLLFGLAPTDIATIIVAVVTMLAVSAFAGYLPARRASRIDPMTALHYE
jgi:predicted permease